ncbi:MAG TPA: hypothetical protein VHU15_05795 [Stellaceae bacterium]|jgi:site-specific recombinase XerD|nr:hypothetical protein [Stellaceae bacterium]
MDEKQSREALVEFLDYLADKGLMAKNTAHGRKAAVTKVLSVLEPSEANNVTTVDIDDVVRRFGNLHGKKYTPGSLGTYKSRLRSALDDFQSYLNNPLAFRPTVQARERSRPKTDKSVSEALQQKSRPEFTRSSPMPMAAGSIVPIPIRPDLTVYIQGLPYDLSETEARKIAAVVTAMAQS